MNKTVFIPNNVLVRDRDTGRKVPALDFSDATRFGKLKEVLHPQDNFLLPDSMVANIEDALASFKDGDYLMAVGDPAAIAICSGILFQKFDTVNLLKWDRKTRSYINVPITI